jgi:hypothetical protein
MGSVYVFVCSDIFVDRKWVWEVLMFCVCSDKCVDRNWGREVPMYSVCVEIKWDDRVWDEKCLGILYV